MTRPYIVHESWRTDKEFTDHIMPLKRFMWNCIGRRWDDVWSEICAAVPSNNTVDQHLLGHAKEDVEINTYMVGDEVWYNGRNGPQEVSGLYVDPRDGVIRSTVTDRCDLYSWKDKLPDYTWHHGYAYVKDETGVLNLPDYKSWRVHRGDFPTKPLNRDEDAKKIGGIWYVVTYAQVPPERIITFVDEDGVTKRKIVPQKRIDAVHGCTFYSGDWYYATKQQMASNDLRKHGLTNDR